MCCQILGVEPGANLGVIKQAYRKKAKLMHPDMSDSPEAHQNFLMLNKAYEYLVQYHELIRDIKISTYTIVKKTAPIKKKKYYGYQKQVIHKNKVSYRHINILESLPGRIIFIFFHIVFLLIGIHMTIYPFIGLQQLHIQNKFALVSPLFTAVFSVIFGCIIITIFIFSGVRLFIQSARNS